MQYYATTRTKQTDTLNSNHENMSKVTAEIQTRCKKHFLEKL